jgi:beta-lactamase regulating signal transducer with metallopeptidase domain
MDPVITAALASSKAMLLLASAALVVALLKGGPARVRAIVLGTSLIGTLAIPLASVLVPKLPVPLPIELRGPGEPSAAPTGRSAGLPRTAMPPQLLERSARFEPIQPAETRVPLPDPASIVLGIWCLGVLLLLARQAASALKTSVIIRRAQTLDDPQILDLIGDARSQTGCRSSVRVVASDQIGVPAVFGVLRPVVMLPSHYTTWLEDRLTAVLQHELTHVARLDWPVRMAARFSCAIYWFNPLGWWAARRLDLEQEMACDEEVLSLGARPSSYACHLLGVARVAIHNPQPATAGLEMARRSDLEERIMRLLQRPTHRKIGLAVILPAVALTAALVPAIASVQPAEPERKASPALKSAMAEMREVEDRLDPHLAEIADIDVEMAPIIEEIEAMAAEIDHEAIARIEAEMAPYLERIEDLQVDMEPLHSQMEAMHEHLESVIIHIDDGTLAEIQQQIHEQMEAHRAEVEAIRIDMAPYREQLERIHKELEPMHDRMAELTREQTARIREQMELNREIMDQQRERVERVHKDLEPLHDELEGMAARVESALVSDVADVLRSHLGPVSSPGAPFNEAAARIIDEGNIHIHDGVLELDASRSEVHEILDDLFSGERVGTREAFVAALEAAVDEVSDLEILLD